MLHNETFRTPINPLFYEEKINFNTKIFSIGSCFAQNIGEKLKENRFDITLNPFGILYNPLSIFKNLENAIIHPEKVDESYIVENEKIYKHFNFHSDISSAHLDKLKNDIISIQKDVKDKLKNVDVLVITLGTSFVFRHNLINDYVGNCHKLPSKEFSQELLTMEIMLDSFRSFYTLLPEDCTIYFTVSPIRHFRNGLVDNNLSKSILRYFTHLVCSEYSNCHYFPSFEIMIDELRDYRFYNEDMVHPTPQALNYIWSYFDEALIDEKTLDTRKKLDKIIKGLKHRPFNPNSVPHQKFLNKLLQIGKSIKEVEIQDLIETITRRIN